VGETKALLLSTLKLDSLDDFAEAVELAFSLTAKHYKVETLSRYHSRTLFTVLKLFFAMYEAFLEVNGSADADATLDAREF